MVYLEFKEAAKKHYNTCIYLLERNPQNWHILENAYYLCGYTIEMMIKYKFFRNINYERDKDIKNLDYNSIKYTTHLQKHNIVVLVNLLRRYEGASILDEVLEYFSKWDVQIRYNGKRNTYNNLSELLDLSKRLIEKFGS